VTAQYVAAVAANAPDAGELDQQKQAIERQAGDVQQQILRLTASGPKAGSVYKYDVTGVKRVVTSSKLSAPKSRTARLGLGALFGLVLGIGISIFLERRSETILGLHSVEATTSLPVITEVPYVRLPPRRRRDVLSFVMPESRVAEAYRGL